jgi:hypothetical protein
MIHKKNSLLGREVRNDDGKKLWVPGMSVLNSNGDLDSTGLGYQYTIQTTTQIRAKVLEQKFYKVPIADFVPVIPGTGVWMEEIKTNAVYDVAGPFEQGLISLASGPSQLAHVDVGTSPKTAKIMTWAKGYMYTVPEVQKALAANNWDVVSGKMSALKRQWDLGLQAIAFLGLKGMLSDVPGLLTNSEVTVDTTTILENISAMSADDFSTFVASILGVYAENSNFTEMPDTFIMPLDDFLGMATPVSASFPMISKAEYLRKAFAEITGNANFQIRGLAYSQAAKNAGYVSTPGTNRYVLYKKDPETLAMDLPVDFTLTPAGTSNNFQWQGVGAGQFTGTIVYRPREVMYYDHS